MPSLVKNPGVGGREDTAEPFLLLGEDLLEELEEVGEVGEVGEVDTGGEV